MPDKPTAPTDDDEGAFFGTVTVGERGQIVIPVEIRKELGIQHGDKLLVCKHPSDKGVMLFKTESVRKFMRLMLESLERAEQDPNAAQDDHNA